MPVKYLNCFTESGLVVFAVQYNNKDSILKAGEATSSTPCLSSLYTLPSLFKEYVRIYPKKFVLSLLTNLLRKPLHLIKMLLCIDNSPKQRVFHCIYAHFQDILGTGQVHCILESMGIGKSTIFQPNLNRFSIHHFYKLHCEQSCCLTSKINLLYFGEKLPSFMSIDK